MIKAHAIVVVSNAVMASYYENHWP